VAARSTIRSRGGLKRFGDAAGAAGETGGTDMSSTSSSSKPGTHLLPILLLSMVLLVAAFIVLVATRAESAGVLGHGFIQ